MPTQANSESLVPISVRRKPKSQVQNYQLLGYILYEATTSPSVTFSYELTGPFIVGDAAVEELSLATYKAHHPAAR